MKFAIIATTALFASSAAFAQNASTGSTTTTGDGAFSPALSNPTNASSSGDNRLGPGAGVASGVLNNGTTSDTIGTGHGTPPTPTVTTGAATGR